MQDGPRPHLPAHLRCSPSSQRLSRHLYIDRHELIIPGRHIAGLVTTSGGGGRRVARTRQRLHNRQRPSPRALRAPAAGPSFEPATTGERLPAGRRSMWRVRLQVPRSSRVYRSWHRTMERTMPLAVTRHTWVPGSDGGISGGPGCSPAPVPQHVPSRSRTGFQTREPEETGGNSLPNPIPGGRREKAGGGADARGQAGRTMRGGGKRA